MARGLKDNSQKAKGLRIKAWQPVAVDNFNTCRSPSAERCFSVNITQKRIINMKNKRNPALIILISLMLIVTSFSAIYYRQGAEATAKEQAYQQLSDLAHEQAATLIARVDGQFALLNSSAGYIASNLETNKQEIARDLDTIISQTFFLNIAYVNAEGDGILNSGETVNVAD